MGGRLIPYRDKGRASIEVLGIWRRRNVTMSGKTRANMGKMGGQLRGRVGMRTSECGE